MQQCRRNRVATTILRRSNIMQWFNSKIISNSPTCQFKTSHRGLHSAANNWQVWSWYRIIKWVTESITRASNLGGLKALKLAYIGVLTTSLTSSSNQHEIFDMHCVKHSPINYGIPSMKFKHINISVVFSLNGSIKNMETGNGATE